MQSPKVMYRTATVVSPKPHGRRSFAPLKEKHSRQQRSYLTGSFFKTQILTIFATHNILQQVI
jgi:hypothetical protein